MLQEKRNFDVRFVKCGELYLFLAPTNIITNNDELD